MRKLTAFLAAGAAFTATPALAQLGIGLGGQGGANIGVGVGANVGVSPGAALGGVTDRLDRTVGTLDRTANGALRSDLAVATAADLTAGAAVSDNRGRRIGVLQSVHGNMAMVVSGNRMLHVPLASLYSSGKGLVTKLSSAQLRAAASANASGGAGMHAGN